MKVANSLPTSLVDKHPLPTFEEAEGARHFYEATHDLGGLLTVKWDNQFYVVYGDDYFNGFTDFTEVTETPAAGTN